MKIGHKLKNLRLKMGLTQAELAGRCDLSKGFISLLETDQTSPSMSTLEDVLNCLGTDFAGFFSDRSEETIVYKRDDVIQKDVPEEGYSIRWLVKDAQKNDMEPIIVCLSQNARTATEEPHGGEEFGYVLAGNIEIHLGEVSHRVKKGESFYFTPHSPHYIKNAGKLSAEVLWVASPPTF